MARFRIDSIAGLARQMGFTPHEARRAQIDSAEDLLHAVDRGKAYPLDFVIYRITGYHPKKVDGALLAGSALQHDLGLLIEQVSQTLDLHATASSDPVLAIEDVTEKFNVTSKTIQRWRRRGLPARRFVFADGKRRVGFLLSSVERFLSTHREQVSRGGNFSQVDEGERAEILRRARRLAGMCGCCRNEISRRIGKKLNRSALTILHTIQKHDQENPGDPIFRTSAKAPGADEKASLVRAYKRGATLGELARRNCTSKSVIYRAIVDERVARIEKKKVRFIDDPLYHQEDAERAIEAIVDQDAIGEEQARADLRVPKDLPPFLAELYRTPLLGASKERGLFLLLNFRKYEFAMARRKFDPQLARARDLARLEKMLGRVAEVRNRIVRANLRLVVSIARRHLRPGLNLMELISDGNLTLMRAIDGFDIHRGTRFSTYATLALMKGFARSVPTMLASRSSQANGERLGELVDVRQIATPAFVRDDEMRAMLSRLDERERDVLQAHYGLGGRTNPATYAQIGRLLGLSKVRVRQIELGAIAKLRAGQAGN